ncbi:hypothetical protein GOBAR_AA00656 [Gossypium barbadense]|uniref:Uncharacterized protein n=1 Tax=Gossypium barbadense TaxID=3634 RepID=A0A2P5YWB6_GOSBA|nr:hypothetical protein GOBAR_AA00656 [Gossypium barbadense]
MLTNFILVSETRFQTIETALKNQQASIQGLENQIGQLAKLISKRPQGSLPSNTKTNPKEQLHAIIVRDEERLVEPKPEPRQESMVLLDKTNPRIATLELNANGTTPFTVLNVFPYGTVEVNHSKFGTFKVNITRLKPSIDNRIDSEKKEFQLLEPP